MDFKNKIEGYMIKKLFIDKKLLNIFYNHIDKSLINFELNIVEYSENLDPIKKLINDFGGIIGETYY